MPQKETSTGQTQPEIIASLPLQTFLRNKRYQDFDMARGQIHGEDSIMYHMRPESRRRIIPLRPVYHTHNYYELIYVTKGVLTQHLERSIFRLNAGDAILLNNQIRHCEGLETDCECIYLQLAPPFLQSLLYTNPINPDTDQHQSNLFREYFPPATEDDLPFAGMALDFRRTLQSRTPSQESLMSEAPAGEIPPAAGQILDQIGEQMANRPWGYAFAVQGLLLQLFQTLEDPTEYHASPIRTNANSDEILYASILHYIQERHGRMSREELASLLHYHPDYLNRVVKKGSGMSFKQLSQKYFLEHVQLLLRDTDLGILDILQELEYSNKTHFYQVFREATGMTPQEYRNQHRKQA